MKIALNMGTQRDSTGATAQDRQLERDLLAAAQGDWSARQNVVKAFRPLIASLAEKRTRDPRKVAELIQAGTDGVGQAAKKYKAEMGPHKFRVAVVDYIEQSMDKAAKGSWLSRLFGKS